MRLPSLSAFALIAPLIPQSYAWGVVGHEIVATIAQMHLHPSVMPKLCDILDVAGECHLAPVAAWADSARRWAKYKWTGPLHYIGAVDDYPSATCAFPGVQGWEGRTHINVLSAIRNTTTVLQGFEASRRATGATDADVPPYVQDALKFLIHFVGDMHMPLHLTGRDRGGNGNKVAFEGRSTNLHSVWDSLLISERLRTLPWNYSQPLPLPEIELYLRDTIYDPYIRRVVWQGLLGEWEDELEDWLACPPVSASAAPPASLWQHVLSPLSWGRKREDTDGAGGLGVDDETLCPYAWAKPIHQLNCEIVFPKELDAPSHVADLETDEGGCSCGDAVPEVLDDAFQRKKSHYLELHTPEYAGAIKEQWIIEKLLTQAGVRLAAVLNWIFVELDEGDQGRYLSL